jgi:hypothetical protein
MTYTSFIYGNCWIYCWSVLLFNFSHTLEEQYFANTLLSFQFLWTKHFSWEWFVVGYNGQPLLFWETDITIVIKTNLSLCIDHTSKQICHFYLTFIYFVNVLIKNISLLSKIITIINSDHWKKIYQIILKMLNTTL